MRDLSFVAFGVVYHLGGEQYAMDYHDKDGHFIEDILHNDCENTQAIVDDGEVTIEFDKDGRMCGLYAGHLKHLKKGEK